MKNILCLLVLVGFVCITQAQEEKNTYKDQIKIEKNENPVYELGYIELRAISPFVLGNHFLNEAYSQDVAGFEMYVNIYKIHDFRIGFGLTRFGSSLTDASLAGNFKRANYRSYYAQIGYVAYQNKVFEAGFSLGYGYNFFRQQTRGERRGSYNTGELRAGVFSRHQFGRNFGLSFGANYLTSNKDVKNSGLNSELYDRIHVINVFLGFYINFE